ncbi:hypothetical protein [Niabella hibiscisoli]|uniref:hypothetical protein n=1 Tax=Niabella hibiscisoli TaxID=1825928 RepID=UPI001F0E9C93|nr:hypothetical protein [Niabella hibiscisoli]MCH5721196.1 hypothetical protein [Niabella hibiscisoli]
MRIEYEIKLGFKDVMIRPKRSTLKTRADVELNRDFTFYIQNRFGKASLLLPPIWTL